MRTTIQVADEVLAEFKRFAADSHRSLGAVIEDALREVLARRRAGRPAHRVRITTFKGRGLQPGVDLDDGAALLDLMEERGDRS
ncbi:MAG: ribbon-helix-helix protein, CopG family [Planctomycetes bacterium]|nr:ribbon-helix-helix protein, CopG family [Planctomycetota bacterium]